MGKGTSAAVAVVALLVLGYATFGAEDKQARDRKRAILASPTAAMPQILTTPSPMLLKGGETYGQYDTRRDSIVADTGRYSGGYGCTGDCSGHDAGRDWAEQHEISDPDECGGKSWSFEEGCRSYAEEQQHTDREDEGDREGEQEE